MGTAIFLVLAWFGFVLVTIFVQILNALAEPVSTILYTPQLDLKHLGYPYLYKWTVETVPPTSKC